MEKSVEQALTLGHRRSPSPPPPPPSHQEHKEEEESSIEVSSISDDDHADINQEPKEEDEEKIIDEEEAAARSGGDPVVLTDELRDKILRQIEYYFSDENLPNDKFMLKHVRKDKQGFGFSMILDWSYIKP